MKQYRCFDSVGAADNELALSFRKGGLECIACPLPLSSCCPLPGTPACKHRLPVGLPRSNQTPIVGSSQMIVQCD